MDPVWTIVIGLAALLSGATIGWLLARQRTAAELAPLQQERATLAERGAGLERELQDARARRAALEGRVAELDRERDAAETERATAAQRASGAERRAEELRAELADRERRLVGLNAELAKLVEERGRLDTALASERKAAEEKLRLLDDAEKKLREAFQSLAGEALKQSSASFLDLAKTRFDETRAQAQGDLDVKKKEVEQLVKPLQETLGRLDTKVGELELKREGAYVDVKRHLDSLQRETGSLVKALRAPAVRGRWGEIGLKRLVEMAGMLEHVDFDTQESVDTEAGRLRPDMTIHLPGGRDIVLDAKVPFSAYLEAHEAQDDVTRDLLLDQHARQVRERIAELSSKAYWQQFQPTPDFVVLFLPAESFYFAALQRDPGLIEAGIEQKVYIATPATLVPILRTVEFGWRQERIAENAQQISELGRELHQRLIVFGEHFARVGTGLGTAIKAYNQAAGSFDSRVLVQARRFKELGASTQELESPDPIELTPRTLQSPELGPRDPGADLLIPAPRPTPSENAAGGDA